MFVLLYLIQYIVCIHITKNKLVLIGIYYTICITVYTRKKFKIIRSILNKKINILVFSVIY